MIHDNMTITIVSNTLHSNMNKNLLCKEFLFDDENEMQNVSHATLTKGTAKTIRINSLLDYQNVIKELKHHQCVMIATCEKERSTTYNLVSKDYKENHSDFECVTRSKKNYSFSKSKSIMMIDFDGHKDFSSSSPDTFRQILITLLPALADVEMLIVPSSSSGIYIEGCEPQKKSGMHIYITLDDGTKIKQVGERLKYSCWAKGLGFHKISSSGSLLERHLVDDTVYSSERLIFEASPKLAKGIHQLPRKFHYFEGGVLSTKNIALSDNERQQLNEMIANNKLSYNSEAENFKLQCKQGEIDDLVSKNISIQDAIIAVDKLFNSDKHILPSLFELKSNRNGYVIVQDIIDNVDKFTNDVFIDPFETRQGNEFRAKIFKNVDGSIIMHSMRHGGTNYILKTKDSDNVIENINKCDDVNNLLTIIDNVKENNNISKND